ncbi:Uncharacterized protein APZ42_031714 [Daphnia magna]|uniref:Uncharacterized protein n=1 Tax=Daphnia magna TaxID=35525 RepID=A0A164MKW0_9CRUS|nr:Uncharacterized protein APZ42_031714 [Daphnia magna]
MCKSLCGMLRGAITWLNETKWPFEKNTKTESFYNIVPEGGYYTRLHQEKESRAASFGSWMT